MTSLRVEPTMFSTSYRLTENEFGHTDTWTLWTVDNWTPRSLVTLCPGPSRDGHGSGPAVIALYRVVTFSRLRLANVP